MSMTHDDVTRAARTMVDVEPPQDLEARIRQRLDREAPQRPTVARWPVVAGVATAVATVVIAVVMRSPDVPESRNSGVLEVAESRRPEVRGTRDPEIPAAQRVIRLPSVRPTMSEAELAWMARRIPALDPIETLTVDHLVLDTIQPASLLITPITITPLAPSPIPGEPAPGR